MAIKMANEGDGNWIKKENKSVNQEKSLVQSYKGGMNTPHSPIGGPLKSKQQAAAQWQQIHDEQANRMIFVTIVNISSFFPSCCIHFFLLSQS